MRTTIDLPDDLYRTLKVRAAVQGITLRDLVRELVQHGLSASAGPPIRMASGQPPVIVPATGQPIPALSAQDLRAMEDEEDAGHVRARR